jgi:hypothetical protein
MFRFPTAHAASTRAGEVNEALVTRIAAPRTIQFVEEAAARDGSDATREAREGQTAVVPSRWWSWFRRGWRMGADSAFYTRDVVAAARRQGVRFSITARKNKAVTAAIAATPEDVWTTIKYPRAIFDEQLQQWVSDAEVAEVPFTSFTSKAKTHRVTGRLIVRGRPRPEPRPRSAERARRAVPSLAPPRRIH